jgi:hypothetical protein
MKTIQILTAIILFNISLASAGGPKIMFKNPLAPDTPKEATFTESDGLETLLMTENMHRALAPATPAEATFEDQYIPEIASPDPSGLAPKTPREADFMDSEITLDNVIVLKPSTPLAADFEEFI